MFIIRFVKNWTLPSAMLIGVIGYFLFKEVAFLSPLKSPALDFVRFITPVLIFLMLFFTFCKINPKDMRPRLWHVWLLLIQIVACVALTLYLALDKSMNLETKLVWEGALACLLCPTATAAAVVTGKLGGNTASLTSYTLESNIVSAVLITMLCPLVEPTVGIDFSEALLKICSQVMRLLVAPFLAAWGIRAFLPKLHAVLLRTKDIAFYLWGIALAIVMAQTLRIVAQDASHPMVELAIALAALAVCAVKFALGKIIGGHYNERISGGQALGQKNTIFAIWMALTYLNPISAVGPGAYVLWQNSLNSWQLWKSRKREK